MSTIHATTVAPPISLSISDRFFNISIRFCSNLFFSMCGGFQNEGVMNNSLLPRRQPVARSLLSFVRNCSPSPFLSITNEIGRISGSTKDNGIGSVSIELICIEYGKACY